MNATNDAAYQYTRIGADAERAARKAAEDNLPVDMMNDRRMQSYAGLWAIIGAKAAATVVLAEAREQFEQDMAEAERRGAIKALRRLAGVGRGMAGVDVVVGNSVTSAADTLTAAIESGQVTL